MALELPDLTTYRLHRMVQDVDLEGVPVPGLWGVFYRRRRGDRLESAGVYRYPDHEVFMAWGYVAEPHCRHHAVRHPDGGWQRPGTGCPRIRVLRTGARVTGLRLSGADHDLVAEPGRMPGVYAAPSAGGLPLDGEGRFAYQPQ